MEDKTYKSGSGTPLQEFDLYLEEDECIEDFPEPERPEWNHWLKMPVVTIKEACWLLVDIEPRSINIFIKNKGPRGAFVEICRYHKCLQVVQSSLVCHELKFISVGEIYIDGMVRLTDFVVWAVNHDYIVPSELLALKTDSPSEPSPDKNTAYISKDLTILNKAAYEFWSSADPEDKTTHPKNEEVAEWLISQGLSKINAQQGAVIIRPEWATNGRRPKQ